MVNSLSWFCYHILNEVSCTDYVSFEMRLKDPDSGAYLDPFNFDFETYDVFICVYKYIYIIMHEFKFLHQQ